MAALDVDFRALLPRLFELKDAHPDPSHPDAYFQGFEQKLAASTHVTELYAKVERDLAALDDAAWTDLKSRAVPHLCKREDGRGWRELFCDFSEARAFRYLVDIGCHGVHFIKRTSKKTPDLEAQRLGSPLLCEVKTINTSDDEARDQHRIHSGEIFVRKVSPVVSQGFLAKFSATMASAVRQLDAHDPDRRLQRIAFVVVHFDDFIGDYQPEYFAQLDEHLGHHQVVGCDLVVCPGRNLFQREFSMRYATVLPE